jgi:hypothetical protein
MSGHPASAYLAEFSRGGDGVRPAPRPPSAAERIEAARAEGYAQGTADATAVAEARLAELRSQFDAGLADARRAWAAEQGARLAGQLQTGLDGLLEDLAQATARVLEPLLAAEVARRTIEELAGTVEALLAREPEAGIAISGPKDILAAMRARMSSAASITYRPCDACEVEVRSGQTVLLTRLQEWARRIEEAGG